TLSILPSHRKAGQTNCADRNGSSTTIGALRSRATANSPRIARSRLRSGWWLKSPCRRSAEALARGKAARRDHRQKRCADFGQALLRPRLGAVSFGHVEDIDDLIEIGADLGEADHEIQV